MKGEIGVHELLHRERCLSLYTYWAERDNHLWNTIRDIISENMRDNTGVLR
jgi:hypothetical protein